MKRGVTLLPPSTELDVAEEIRRTDDPRDFPQSILTHTEAFNVKVREKKFIISNFILEESINIINGYRGCGKSWLALALADAVTWGSKVGPWEVEDPVNVLYVDGEMTFSMLQERFKLLNIGRDVSGKPRTLFFYPESYAYRIGLNRASILDPTWRNAIREQCDILDIGLLILDNLSSLAPGIDENVKMEFDPVNRWLLELRYSGVSTVLVHHTGKSGEQRGTSAHEDHVDVSVMLSSPPGYSPVQGCKFIWRAIKDRAMVTNKTAYVLQLVEGEDGRVQMVAGGVEILGKGEKVDQALSLLEANPNITHKEAKEMGISSKTYYRAKEALRSLS